MMGLLGNGEGVLAGEEYDMLEVVDVFDLLEDLIELFRDKLPELLTFILDFQTRVRFIPIFNLGCN